MTNTLNQSLRQIGREQAKLAPSTTENTIIGAMSQKFRKGGFARSVLTVATGTALAQLITIAVAPVLTRLYAPSAFGLFALYTSVSAVIAILATGRYDVAIMLPHENEEAVNLLALSGTITIAISLLTLAVILFLHRPIALWLGNEVIGPWLSIIPLSVGVNAFCQAMRCWTTRQKRFRLLSVARICGTATGATVSIGIGLLSGSVGGLILGAMVTFGISTAILTRQMWIIDAGSRSSIRGAAIWSLARRYYKFPLYSLPADFVNAAAQQVPIIFLMTFFGAAIVGLFALTQRVLAYPLGLIASSILEVFRQRASADFNAHGNCRDVFMKTFKSLALVSIVPFGLLFLTAPWLFSLVFGEQWKVAGAYARILAPFFMLRFVASPLSYVLYVVEKQRIDMALQIVLLLVTSLAIILGAWFHNPKLSISLYAGSYSVIYIIYLWLSYYYSGMRCMTTGLDGKDMPCDMRTH